MDRPLQTSAVSVKGFGYKVPLVLISLLILLALWVVSPPSFLSYSQISLSQIQMVFGSPAVTDNVKNNFYPIPDTHQPSSPSNGGEAANSRSKSETHTEAPFTTTATNTNTSDSEGHPPLAPNSTQPDQVDPVQNGTVGAFTDADDSQLVEFPKILEAPSAQKTEDSEKFLMPGLSYGLGTGNQLLEYKSAIVIARTLNRTLCLSPFFPGPSKHIGFLGASHSGLSMEERYNIEALSKFVKVASMPECVQACHGKLDVSLRLMKMADWKNMWFNDTPQWSVDFFGDAFKWSSVGQMRGQMAHSLGTGNNDAKCMGLGGLFSALRWRGVYYASSAYLEHSQDVNGVADHLLARSLLGNGSQPFVGVHWRFEEGKCRGHALGLCFSRCADGSVVANGRKSEIWESLDLEGKKQGIKFWKGNSGVYVRKEDISGAIYDKAKNISCMNVYLATDGWIRGDESREIVKWVVEDLRSKNVTVTGLWEIPGLPNFADGGQVTAQNIAEVLGMPPKTKASSHIIAMVEQEVCERSTAFIGSGQSTWSLAVADRRQGRECRRGLSEQKRSENPTMSETQLQNEVMDQILDIQFGPWPTCRGSTEFNEVEANDGWLDYDACEGRILKNVGSCKRIRT